MTPLDLVWWALGVLVAVAILIVPVMVAGALVLEFRRRWRDQERS